MALIKLVNSNLKYVIFDSSQIVDVNEVNGVCVIELTNRQHILRDPYTSVVKGLEAGSYLLGESK